MKALTKTVIHGVCMCVCVCVLTEISQAGQRGGLQLGVTREHLTGSERHPLDTVVHQDVVVTLCEVKPSKHTLGSNSRASDESNPNTPGPKYIFFY